MAHSQRCNCMVSRRLTLLIELIQKKEVAGRRRAVRLAEDICSRGRQARATGDSECPSGGVTTARWSPLKRLWGGQTGLIEAEQAARLDAVVAKLRKRTRLRLRQLLLFQWPPACAAARSTRAKGKCWCSRGLKLLERKGLGGDGMLQPVDGLRTTDPSLPNVFLPLPSKEESSFGTWSCGEGNRPGHDGTWWSREKMRWMCCCLLHAGWKHRWTRLVVGGFHRRWHHCHHLPLPVPGEPTQQHWWASLRWESLVGA